MKTPRELAVGPFADALRFNEPAPPPYVAPTVSPRGHAAPPRRLFALLGRMIAAMVAVIILIDYSLRVARFDRYRLAWRRALTRSISTIPPPLWSPPGRPS